MADQGAPRYRETILGLHPRTCRRCPSHGERVVSLRQRGLFFGALPILTLDSLWRRCVACDDRWAWPRFNIGPAVALTLVVAFLFGRGWFSVDVVVTLLLLAFVWGIWLLMRGIEGAYRDRLIALPTPMRRAIRARSRTPDARAPKSAPRAERTRGAAAATVPRWIVASAEMRRRPAFVPRLAYRLGRLVARKRLRAVRRPAHQ